MRVLLDECLPRPLRQDLVGHEVTTVQEAGWSGKTNGELLVLAEGAYDVLVTMDYNIQFENALAGRQLSVLAFRAPSNRVEHLRPLVPSAMQALQFIRPGQFVVVPDA